MTDRKNFRFGESCAFFGKFNEEICSEYQKSGVDLMELSVSFSQLVNELDFFNKSSEIAETAKKYGVKINSFHIPFGTSLDISTSDETALNKIMLIMYKFIIACAEAEIPIAVIHPSYEPISDDIRLKRLEICRKSLKKLSDFSESCGVKLAVENLPRTCLGNCPDDINYILDGCDNLYVVFDTNHYLKGKNEDFIREVGLKHPGKIISLHVSDYDFIDEKHWLPGDGKIDWDTLLSALEEIGYDGPFMHEIGGGKCDSLSAIKANSDRILHC